MFPREFNFDVDRFAIRLTMTPNISLTVMTDVHDRSVLGVELTYRMIPSYAAVSTESRDDLVL